MALTCCPNCFAGSSTPSGNYYLCKNLSCGCHFSAKQSLEDISPFLKFSNEVRDLLEYTAVEKGYNTTGADGPNQLYDFINTMNAGPGHPAGEIIYKIQRYMRKKDKKDLLKIAAWAFLIWRLDK